MPHTFKGESITVRYREKTGTDVLGNAVYEWHEEAVKNVLLSPGDTGNPAFATFSNIADGSPDAIEVDLKVFLPRDYRRDLRGAQLIIRGNTYQVQGAPEGYVDADLPPGCLWNRVAKAVRFDG